MVALNAATAEATADLPAIHRMSWMYAAIVRRHRRIWARSKLDLVSGSGLLSLNHSECQ
jgi:hypothetical protein